MRTFPLLLALAFFVAAKPAAADSFDFDAGCREAQALFLDLEL